MVSVNIWKSAKASSTGVACFKAANSFFTLFPSSLSKSFESPALFNQSVILLPAFSVIRLSIVKVVLSLIPLIILTKGEFFSDSSLAI